MGEYLVTEAQREALVAQLFVAGMARVQEQRRARQRALRVELAGRVLGVLVMVALVLVVL